MADYLVVYLAVMKVMKMVANWDVRTVALLE